MRTTTLGGIYLAALLLAAAAPTCAQTPPLLKVAVGNDYVEIDSTGAQYYSGKCNVTACPGSSAGTAAGSILWTGTIDGFSVYGLNGVTPVPAAPQIDIGETGIVAPAAGGTITISYTATGFTVGASPAIMSIVPGTAVSQTYTSYVDDTNAPFGAQITVGTLGSAGGMLSGEGPLSDAKGFSITDVETIQLAAGTAFNGDFNLQVTPHAPLVLTCASGSGVVGAPFSSMLTATGGDTPYTYSISSGPSWLKVNANTGALSGTPTAAGVLSFTAQVMDSSGVTGGNTASTSCTISIAQSSGHGGGDLVSGDTATIGFWHNKNGQALIDSLNGSSSSTSLGNWLASNFPGLFGPASGNNTTNKPNTYIASLFLDFFGAGGAKTEAQVMAGALACYVTSTSLSGGSYAGSYGFNLSSQGTIAKSYNVESNGAALGLTNNQSYLIGALLAAANAKAPWSSSVANALNNIFSDINQNGDIN